VDDRNADELDHARTMNQVWRLALDAAILALCVGALGCASGAGPVDERVSSSQQALSTVDGGSPAVGPATARADERARIRAALDAHYYSSADVVYTFEGLYGDVIDCVDYYAQPAARSLKAHGKPVPDPQPSARSAQSRASLPDYMYNGKPDRLGRPRACPDGTVPLLRVTEDEILAAGGLDAFRKINSHKPPRPGAMEPPGLIDGHHHTTQLSTLTSNITSSISTISVYAPTVPSIDGFSLGQTWTSTGTKSNAPNGCTLGVDCFQTVEAGWHVFPSHYGMNPTSAHFFTYATNNGYMNPTPGCYNTLVVDGNDNCLDFVLQQSAPMTPGATLQASVIGGTQVEIQIYIAHNTNGWCLSTGVNNNLQLVGCWPSSDFFLGMQNAATAFQVGAEAAAQGDDKWLIPMGSGRPPGAGYRQAAYQRDFAAFAAPDWSYSFQPDVFLDVLSFGQSSNTPPGGAWTNWFYFGSEPEIGWVARQIDALE
jgi:hypothetical protein